MNAAPVGTRQYAVMAERACSLIHMVRTPTVDIIAGELTFCSHYAILLTCAGVVP